MTNTMRKKERADEESVMSSSVLDVDSGMENPDLDINKILTKNFDVGDAFLLHDNINVPLNTLQDEEAFPTKNEYTEGYNDLGNQSVRSSDLDSNGSRNLTTKASYASHNIHEYDGYTRDSEFLRNVKSNATSYLSTSDKESIIKKVYTNQTTGEVDLPPDGGYGWVSTFCVFLIMFSTWGCNSSFGVFLAFYLNNNTFEGASKYDYALIAGLTVFLGQLCSPLVAILMRLIGFKPTMLFGTTIMFAGFLLASYATKLWHLYVTQGFMIGVSISLTFIPATTVIPGWFLRKRAVAMGLSLSATGVGGVVYGLAVNKLIQDDGNTKWALRMLCIVTTVTTLVAITFIKQRIPTKPIGIRSITKIKEQFILMFKINLKAKPYIALIAFWFTFALLGYNLMIFTLSSYAISKGLTAHDGSTLTAVLNGCQAIGRPTMGFLGDRYGRANVTTVLTTVILILLFAFWMTAHTFVQLLFFVIMLGSCVGVANVMNTVLIADMVGPDDFLQAWSFINYSGASFFLVVEVIAQALVDKELSNPYQHTQIFAGLCFVVALILILLLRQIVVKLKFLEQKEKIERKLSEYDNDIDNEDEQLLVEGKLKLVAEQDKYNKLLAPGLKGYFTRMTYPMRV